MRRYVFTFLFVLAGNVSVQPWQGTQLPYIDNLVDLVVVSAPVSVDRSEILRVLVPGGIATFLDAKGSEDKSKRISKSRPN